MGNYAKLSNFNPKANYNLVRFGEDTPITECELNELQQIQQQNDLMYRGEDRFLTKGELSLNNGTLTLSKALFLNKGLPVPVATLTTPLTDNQVAYLKLSDNTITPSSKVNPFGNQQDTNFVPNTLLDSRLSGIQSAIRHQTTYDVETYNTHTQSSTVNVTETNIRLGDIPKHITIYGKSTVINDSQTNTPVYRSVGEDDGANMLLFNDTENIVVSGYTSQVGYWLFHKDSPSSNSGTDIYHRSIQDYYSVEEGKEYLLFNLGEATIYYDENKTPVYFNLEKRVCRSKYHLPYVSHNNISLVTIPKGVKFIRVTATITGSTINDFKIYKNPNLKHTQIIEGLSAIATNNGVTVLYKDCISNDPVVTGESTGTYLMKQCGRLDVPGHALVLADINITSFTNTYRLSLPLYRTLDIDTSVDADSSRLCLSSEGIPYKRNYTEDIEHFYIEGSSIVIFLNKSKLTTVTAQGVVDYFNAKPFSVIFPLKTQVKIPLDDIDLSYNGIGKMYLDSGRCQGVFTLKRLGALNPSIPPFYIPIAHLINGVFKDLRYSDDKDIEFRNENWDSKYPIHQKIRGYYPNGALRYKGDLSTDTVQLSTYDIHNALIGTQTYKIVADNKGNYATVEQSSRKENVQWT